MDGGGEKGVNRGTLGRRREWRTGKGTIGVEGEEGEWVEV